MLDFKNASFLKLRAVKKDSFDKHINQLIIPGESVIGAFQGIRDGVVFTTKRVIAINVQGMTGKKKDYSSLPYNRIQAYAIETSGVFDLDSELELWFSGLGKIRFEFTSGSDIPAICRFISEKIL